jgi:hypothetical protein
MQRLRLKLLFVGITVLGLMVATALPAQAQNRLLTDRPRTIESRSDLQSQVWHMQIWGRGSRTGCYIFGRSLMDTYRGPGSAFDYLDSIFIRNLDTGASAVGEPDADAPPVAIRTREIFMRGVSYDIFTVRGTAHVYWSTDRANGPTGVHEIPRHGVVCTPTLSATGETMFTPEIDGVQPDDTDLPDDTALPDDADLQ